MIEPFLFISSSPFIRDLSRGSVGMGSMGSAEPINFQRRVKESAVPFRLVLEVNMGNLRLYEGPENPWVPLDLGLIPIETNTQSPKF